ncbi:glycerophosphodiester phosphodiesterase GDPD1, chloroplastic isoform X2 [Beta vulgaris subsp. vulgaris]|uniref:glycerophosphodiester phosphodiesterase GDPD1, chloroplastic isoform X2 n=1 Tax=Beta vulgaris subsp. vulgaris TaxID=3555 RepID=UPI002036A069|nr:glycerophosphodiester phosphodiesterase GDPD1, chloroplastic isoform X2 [Beta vulgaris subsp. vulgaris]
MALKAIHLAEVPNYDHSNFVPENATILSSTYISSGCAGKSRKFMVMGHRGSGMNIMQSSDPQMKCFKENSILSFNNAAQFNLDFIEFDVQGVISEKIVTEITLEEILSYGPKKEPRKVGKPLLRKAKDGSIFEWKVENDGPLCTLQEAFEKVDTSLGFNIELKLDDHKIYDEVELKDILQAVLKIVDKYTDQGRSIMFSSFHPDATQLMRKLQDYYPVFFLTNGGCEIHTDPRRNSLEEAVKLCIEAGLQGIVSQVRAIFRHPAMVSWIKESKLSLITYGQLNNVPEAVYMQHLMGVEGVIVDFVHHIRATVLDLNKTYDEEIKDENSIDGKEVEEKRERSVVKFSDRELSFLLKLIPELIQTA